MPKRSDRITKEPQQEKSEYLHILKDRYFMSFVGAFTMTGMASSLVFVLLPVYTKENLGLLESQNGFLMTINALMVVFLQVGMTQLTKKHPGLSVLALGSLLYALGVGSMMLWGNFWGFAIGMVVMTLGELMVQPTSTTMAANLAPVHLRASYMSIFGLGWSTSHGFGPVVGGLLNDNVGPYAIWLGGLCWGLLGMLTFLALRRRTKLPAPEKG